MPWLSYESDGPSGYDRAQICTNGHLITSMAATAPQHRKNFCSECGAATIDACTHCSTSIKGHYHVPGVFGFGEDSVPSYCEGCGAPFPWQVSAIENLKELLREGDLSEEEIIAAEATLPDVLRATPKTESAALKLGRLMRKLGKPTYDVAIKVVSDIASETAKKTMGL